MAEWLDPLTGRRYQFSRGGLRSVRRHVAELLRTRLARASTLREQADTAARFWAEEYYGLIFPLGFSKVVRGEWVGAEILRSGPVIDVGDAGAYRGRRLEGYPPIIPAGEEEPTEALLADIALVRAALAGVLLRQKGIEGARLDTVRLACLTAPLADELLESRLELPGEVRRVIASLSEGEQAPLPFDLSFLQAVWQAVGSPEAARNLPEDLSVVVVIGAVQRVKQYVFETPGLNEIRGGSELLEQIAGEISQTVARELGPEVVVRAAGAQVEFLAPSVRAADGTEWVQRVQSSFLEATGGVLAAAAARVIKVKDLLVDYRGQMRLVYQDLETARSKAVLPLSETLPFEQRCTICQRRAAEGWFRSPEGIPETACRVCITKREWGRKVRQEKTGMLEGWLGDVRDPWGVGEAKPPQSLNDLCQEGARRRWVAVIYGDGNNFGAVVERQESLVQAIQWTRRVKAVTESAAALALSEAMRAWQAQARKEEDLLSVNYLPFQVLALGGEDLSLFCWAPIGVRFAHRFIELTDAEFERPEGSRGPRICFSLGLLITDEKAPVRRTVDFAEEQLLKWAKRAARQADYRHGGTVSFLLAPSADQIPGSLDDYKEQMYRRQGKIYSLCLTLRPLTAAELGFLIRKAEQLRLGGHAGQLERMAEAFLKGQPQVAVLHYLYQKVREQRRQEQMGMTGLLEDTADAPPTLAALKYPATPLQQRRVFGEELQSPEEKVWFTPVADLVELVKTLT
ncbi:MAG: hypothetical protein ACPLRW_04865 [Moorellales bacterium]